MKFYDFLWESVKKPKLLEDYASNLGLEIHIDKNIDFYKRLKEVALAAVEVVEFEISRLDEFVPQQRERCAELRRFIEEAIQDLKAVGEGVDGLRRPRC